MKKLVQEAVAGLGVDSARIFTNEAAVNTTTRVIKEDKELSGKVIEVKPVKCTGGVIAETADGKLRVDNTYETRLDMLLARMMPEIEKELFGGSR